MKKLVIFIFIAIVALVLFVHYSSDFAPDTKRITADSAPTKIGVVFVGPAKDGGWSEAHFNGFEKAKQAMNLDITYCESVSDQDESFIEVAENLIRAGNKLIFAISFDYGKTLMKIAEKYPQVYFFHATGVEEKANVATYFGRIYQMRYLTGIVAGLQTKTNEIGYVAAVPIYEVVRGINAFTLGVRSVNPNAIVHVRWTKSWNNPQAEKDVAESLFADYNIDIIAQHQNTTNAVEVAKAHGKWAIGYNLDRSDLYPDTFLTAPTWNWDVFYTNRIKECLAGEFKGKHYWDGIDTVVVDIAPLNVRIVKKGIAEQVEIARQRFTAGNWDVFYGPIRDQAGKIRVEANEALADQAILHEMNWFVEGVEGTIE